MAERKNVHGVLPLEYGMALSVDLMATHHEAALEFARLDEPLEHSAGSGT